MQQLGLNLLNLTQPLPLLGNPLRRHAGEHGPPLVKYLRPGAARSPVSTQRFLSKSQFEFILSPPRKVVQQLGLNLLNFRKPLPLLGNEVVKLFVQQPDFQLGLEVNPVIVLAA